MYLDSNSLSVYVCMFFLQLLLALLVTSNLVHVQISVCNVIVVINDGLPF